MKLPLFISLTEARGDSTTRLAERMRSLASDYSVGESVELVQIRTNESNSSQSTLEYSLTMDTADQVTSNRVLAFLTKVNESLFDNFPTFIEPPISVTII